MVMKKVNLFEAKARLSEYLDRAAGGERIVVCRHNKPVAELCPVAGVRTDPRPVGPLPGRPVFDLPPSFFEPMTPDELELWDGAVPTYPSSRESSATAPTRVAKRRTRRRAARRTTTPGSRRS